MTATSANIDERDSLWDIIKEIENQKEVEQLLIDLVADVEVDNQKIDFDKEFSQNYDTFLLLVLQVIKLNYLDSFQRLVTNLPKD